MANRIPVAAGPLYQWLMNPSERMTTNKQSQVQATGSNLGKRDAIGTHVSNTVGVNAVENTEDAFKSAKQDVATQKSSTTTVLGFTAGEESVAGITSSHKRQRSFISQQTPRKQQKRDATISPTTGYADAIIVIDSDPDSDSDGDDEVQAREESSERPQQSVSPAVSSIEVASSSGPKNQEAAKNPISSTAPVAHRDESEKTTEQEVELIKPTPQQAYISWLESEQRVLVTRIDTNQRECQALSEELRSRLDLQDKLAPQKASLEKNISESRQLVEDETAKVAEYDRLLRTLKDITVKFCGLCHKDIFPLIDNCQKKRDEHENEKIKAMEALRGRERQLEDFEQRWSDFDARIKDIPVKMEELKKSIEKDECGEMAYEMLRRVAQVDPIQLAGLGKEYLKNMNWMSNKAK